jgi:hypothetical protein
MSEPRRLQEEGASSLERALLEAGASYRSTEAMRASTLAALGLAGSVAMGGTAAAASSVFKAAWVKPLLLVSAIGAAVGLPAAYYVVQAKSSPVGSNTAPIRAAAPAQNMPVPNVGAPSEPSDAAQAGVPEALRESSAPESVTPKGPSRASSRPLERASLSEELHVVDSARALLAAGNARGALSQLDAYSRSFPHGRLRLEAEVIRIDALAKNGQPELAKKRAQSFVTRYPKSVLASRVRAYLGAD